MTTTYPNKKLRATELQLGDVLQMYDGPFGTAVIVKVEGSSVHFFRPYATTTDFSHSGSVIPYIGIEQGTIRLESTSEWLVLERKELR